MINNPELQAALALLNKGLKVRVSAPLLFRVFGKREHLITIYPPFLGTMRNADLVTLKAGLTDEKIQEIADGGPDNLEENVKPIARVAAVAWLNNGLLITLLSPIVGWWFEGHLTSEQLYTFIQVFGALSNRSAFTNTIILTSSLRRTRPNLSQTIPGS